MRLNRSIDDSDPNVNNNCTGGQVFISFEGFIRISNKRRREKLVAFIEMNVRRRARQEQGEQMSNELILSPKISY